MFSILCIILLYLSIPADIQALDAELAKADEYDKQHELQIAQQHQKIAETGGSFSGYLDLFELYASYKFDSAHHYVSYLEKYAQTADERAIAKIKKSFILFSAGLFKESHDALDAIDYIEECSPAVQERYYAHYARLSFDEGVYAGEPYYEPYTQRGIELLDKQLSLLTEQDTTRYYYALALKAMKQEHHKLAIHYFEKCLEATSSTEHQLAIAYSTLAYPASQTGGEDLALQYFIQAAIYDIRSSIKEGVALRWVATKLHERGNCDLAHTYIMQANRDADFYGARHRKMEVSQILPIIEHEVLQQEQVHHRLMYMLLLVVLVGLLLLSILLIYLKRKMNALSRARDEIEQMNQQLNELGKLKEEYIGSYLSWQSDTIRAVDSSQVHINRLARERDLKGLVAYIEALPKHNRRQEFMQQFDRMFLRICPNFVNNFNELLKPEYRIYPGEGELLTTELRIFALIRLGITSNEQIASVLDYSINTVYTYKTKMRNRSILNSDEFYAAAAKC